MRRSIDLHAHSTASDGALTPTELMRLAARRGLSALAVTDHDTLGGLAEAEVAAADVGVELVPGVEIAVDYPYGKMELLGLLIDRHSPGIGGRLDLLQRNRANRNAIMVDKMQALGLDVTLAEFEEEAGGPVVGRPHMARVLVRKGIVHTPQEAFDGYLAAGGPAYVPKDKIGVEEGLRLIHEAGGVAVMAHPHSTRLPDDELLGELLRLKDLGLDGVECYYSIYHPDRMEALLRLTQRAGLLPSGGSDFHGPTKPDVRLGCVDGDLPAPAHLLDALKQRAASRRHPAT